MRNTPSPASTLAACWRRVEKSMFAAMVLAVLPNLQVRDLYHANRKRAQLAHGV
jgi:hypothetical protein